MCVCVFPIPMSVSFSLSLLKVQRIREWSRKRQDPNISLPVFNICALPILPSETVSLKTPRRGQVKRQEAPAFVFLFIMDFLFVCFVYVFFLPTMDACGGKWNEANEGIGFHMFFMIFSHQ